MALLSWVIAAVTAATSAVPPAVHALSEDERRSTAVALAEEEEEWRVTAARTFPGDFWSRDDAFFSLEHIRIRDFEAQLRTSPGEILLGIDELLREDPRGRKTTAAPCKPRPFFD